MAVINGYAFDVLKIVDYLKPFRDDVAKSFNWGSPNYSDLDKAFEIGLFSNDEMDILLSMDSMYERNVLIKTLISKKLTKPMEGKEADYYNWIVKEWGRIKAYNKPPDYVTDSINTLIVDNYLSLNSIASMSKIAGFMYPEKFVIYDARVCYSLNWILLKNKASDKYFPVPESRNTKLKAFDIGVIIRLINAETYHIPQDDNSILKKTIKHKDNELYVDQGKAYTTLCELICQVNDLLWENDDEKKRYPFHTEMILFVIADQDIVIDIINSCKLNFGH